MYRRTILSLATAVAASATLTAALVRGAAPAEASGNFSDWGPPENLGSPVNSSGDDQQPAISKDGLSLYVSSTRPGGQGRLDLWVSHRDSDDDPWGAPVNLGPTINSSGGDVAPTFSADGHKLYFHSDRTGTLGLFDLWVCTRTDVHDDFAWSAPVNLGVPVNSTYNDAGAAVLDEDDGTMTLWYNIDKPGGLGDFDIYKSILGVDGTFSAPVNVTELNSSARDSRPAVRHDGREMILYSERPGGVASGPGVGDLWVATRATRDDPWSTPENLGAVVNSTSTDGAPALSWNGQSLYFSSNRPGGVGGNDLYVCTRHHPAN